MSFALSLRSEMLKTKRTASFYLTLFAAAFGPLVTILEIMSEGLQKNDKTKILNILFIEEFQVTGILSLPLFLMLICTLLPQIEYRNNTWKQVLITPETKASIYFSKFMVIQQLTVAFFIINLLFTFVCAVLLHVKHFSWHVLIQPLDWYEVIMLRMNSYIVLLGFCTIQFWLGLRFKNFIAPITIGVACYVAGAIIVMQLSPGKILYLPYTLVFYNGMPEYASYVSGLNWYSIGYTLAFLSIGYFDFRNKNMVG